MALPPKNEEKTEKYLNAKKVTAAVEALIWKHHTQESYTRIKNVMQPNSGGGLQ
jgi:hypothetical protein